mmetsp:Transcript_17065/g.44115  ORF Transcript_17065/g.44115 Transcript_17065/m.44115 type:complete len:426 (-) Transcript_17065:158-1435(-)
MATFGLSERFTLESALFGLFGGLLIAVAASLNLLLRGRITGISGILTAISSLQLKHSKRSWRLGFLAGMVACSAIVAELVPSLFAADPVDPSIMTAIIAGVLVGAGTKIGSGCTSGHGVCGLPRLSRRSLVSVCTFVFIGVVTATTIGSTGVRAALSAPAEPNPFVRWPAFGVSLVGLLALLVVTARGGARPTSASDVLESTSFDVVLSAVLGALFAGGLALSGMVQPSRVIGFLDPVEVGWDGTLACVLAGAVCFNLVVFRAILKRTSPLLTCEFELPTSRAITRELVGGALIFGTGWGMSGLCPGPALCALAAGKPVAIVFTAAVLGSQLGVEQVQERMKGATKITPNPAPAALEAAENGCAGVDGTASAAAAKWTEAGAPPATSQVAAQSPPDRKQVQMPARQLRPTMLGRQTSVQVGARSG